MESTIDKVESLRRYAMLLERLCSPRYALAISVAVDTDDEARIDAQEGKPLKQCGVIIGNDDQWTGDIFAVVRAPDLQLDRDHIPSLSSWFHKCGPPYADLLGEAMLRSHLSDFEEFSTHIGPLAWERGCMSATHRRYGLDLLSEEDDAPSGLRFQFHASAIVQATNERLKQAAEEGGAQ